MRCIDLPTVEKSATHRCPRCAHRATVHGRFTRAIDDWEVTFVECVRLRCCGRTFTVAPPGVTPGARYSDRVVRLARGLVGMGMSVRRTAGLLHQAGVRVTPQTVQAWSRGVPRSIRADVDTGPPNGSDLWVELRPEFGVRIRTRTPEVAERLLKTPGDLGA